MAPPYPWPRDFLAPSAAFAQKPYSVLTRWKIGGEGGWDYLTSDPKAHRLYVTHGPRVEVLDTDSGKVVGSITGLKGTHGVALDDAESTAMSATGARMQWWSLTAPRLATVASIPAGTNPDGIVFEPVTKTVWAFNGRSSNATVIDTAQRKVVATIALSTASLSSRSRTAPARSSPTSRARMRSSVSMRRQRDYRDVAAGNCESPSGLAIDPRRPPPLRRM
jgi:hypothetical protein